ncbi:DNA circularization N-terminal domain-containing protein [Pseudomonas ogarae]|uniref:DNA circularization protein n=1 Tax=Pseudomonas ogarae (strain DSM 112162 / CECT 30235 / F113) TaxID=1114970 RepID=UPI0016458346|nr:DNA circularization N-terminal domain-containing protein [Pseudomonas zarinae]QXH96121.1 DNA circularization N-terminal domain-containing protein [Pseudomonas zarinae]
MARDWRKELLPASFRGINFLIPQASVPVGQKGQLHEYPQRDEPFFEQLGKQAQVHTMTAWVIGDDCFERRDKLLEALQTPGPGELVHPWLGRMQVKVGDCKVSHELTAGGMVSFDLTFYPDKPLTFPTAKVNSQQQVVKASDSMLGSALERYKQAMAKVDQARLGLLRLRNSLSNVYAVIQQQFAPFVGVFTNLTGFVQSLMNSPGALSSLFSSYFSDFSLQDSAFSDTSSSYKNAVATTTQQTEAVSAINSVSQSGGIDSAAAAQATANLVQDALLVQVALIISEMPIASQPVSSGSTPSVEQQAILPAVRPEVPVADDVLQLRDSLSDAIFEASLKADPAHYVVMNTLRQTLVKHLTAVAESGVRLVDITPPETMSALVLAYQRFGDATRSAEVVQRNRIRHPGFVPAESLKIAQR